MQIGQSQESEWLRQTSQLRLAQLDALDQIDALRALLVEFTRRTGQSAASWEQIGAAGLLRQLPVDPTGTPYVLDAATGNISVRSDSPLSPLPTEPVAAPELGGAAPPLPR